MMLNQSPTNPNDRDRVFCCRTTGKTSPLGVNALRMAIAGLVSLTFAPDPGFAFSIFRKKDSPYEICVKELQQAKASAESIPSACSTALRPKELSSCVLDITLADGVEIGADDALANCRQVRRPDELSTCVIDIRQRTEAATTTEVLSHCRRSLLPLQFSQCVVALSVEQKQPADSAMSTCLDGRDRPRDFYPTSGG